MDPHSWNQLGLVIAQYKQRRSEDGCCDAFKKVASAHIYFKDKKIEERNDNSSESYHSETNNESEGGIMVKVKVMAKSFLTLFSYKRCNNNKITK